jgi:hypothetical protein
MASASPIDALIDDLTADRARLAAAVEQVPSALRGRRPAADRWSVAEILEHLVIVEQRATTIVRDLAASAPQADGASARSPGALDRTVLRDRSQRVMAPAVIQPTGTMDADTAWAALARSRTALLAAVREAEGRDLAAVNRTHPRLGPLTGYEWIAALGGHEERHAAQIAEIAELMTPT